MNTGFFMIIQRSFRSPSTSSFNLDYRLGYPQTSANPFLLASVLLQDTAQKESFLGDRREGSLGSNASVSYHLLPAAHAPGSLHRLSEKEISLVFAYKETHIQSCIQRHWLVDDQFGIQACSGHPCSVYG